MSEYLSGRFCDEQIQQGAGWYTCFSRHTVPDEKHGDIRSDLESFQSRRLIIKVLASVVFTAAGPAFPLQLFFRQQKESGSSCAGRDTAFGLFELYIFGNREKGLLIPVGILGGLSFLFFFSFSLSKLLSFNTGPYAMPLLLIGVGLIVMSSGKKTRG